MDKVFAPNNSTFVDTKTKSVIYDFPPRDAELRNKYFPAGIKHQAKYNLYMLKEVIDYVSEPGERIMDIMSGTGGTMLAATMGRKVTCIEISPKWTEEYIRTNKAHILSVCPGVKDTDILIINSACQDVLPLPCDHIIFSPPYSVIMKKASKTGEFTKGDITGDFYGVSAEEFAEYSNNPGNVGGLNKFMYTQLMGEIYGLCAKSIRPGGTLTVIIKDYIENQKRQYISKWVSTSCIKAGLELKDWFKWNAPGGPFLNIYRSRGWEVVEDEDIMVFRRPL
jgi:hypothetical protein